MSGPFYARYVPPKAKPAEQPAPPSNPASPVIQRSTDNANPARAQLFARYVPPKPSRPAPSQKQLSREKEAEEENIQDSSTKEREAKKKKKDRKERSKKRSKAHEEEQEHDEDAAEFGRTEDTGPDGDGDQIMKDISQDEEEESSASEREEKPRKAPKKRKRRDEEQKDGEGDEDDTHLKKHKSILSKFEKSSKISDVLKQTAPEGDDQPQEPVELHDLVPLPQPEPVPEAEYKPTFSALPSWLSRPTVISSQTRTPFSSLNIHPKLMDQIEGKGYKEAFAVQSGLIPLLLPGPQQHIGDVCVSAATGSGKTLGYVLPLIQNLRERVVIRLRGLIVVPTRELVTQAKEVAELCAVGTGIKIGTALGNQSFPSEQAALVKTVNRYDPEGYEELQVRGKKELLSNGSRDEQLLEDCARVLPNHTLSFESNVDILICTPGRLVDHIRATRGFSLRDVQWLVIDEADRLLDQSFQEWAETLINAVEAKQAQQELSVRDQIVAQLGYPEDKQAVKKIILSATMTRDLAKLSALKLRRPKMLIVQDQDKVEQAYEQGAVPDSVTQAEAFEIPRTLREFAMPVGDGTEKALFLLHLLQSRILHGQHDATSKRSKGAIRKRRSASVSSASSSSSDDSTSSDSSGSSVSSDSTDSSISSDSSDSSDAETSASSDSGTDRDATPKKSAPGHQAKVLIFTKDNENASRLSHLLAKLHPPYAGIIGTLTKSSATSAGRKVLAAFRSGKTWLLIASDRASRGLDVPDLTHIVNYDIPRSVTAYVHRVGRTARAGKSGDAWTFFTNAEGKWFWNAIARAPEIKRNGGKVVRVKPEANAITEDMRAAYGAALQELQLAVQGNATDAHR